METQRLSTKEPASLVCVRGLEPPRPFGHQHLSLACLPFHHTHIFGTQGETRTPKLSGLNGATLPICPLGLILWCPKRDSNSHALRPQGLSLLCLPFHHSDVISVIPFPWKQYNEDHFMAQVPRVELSPYSFGDRRAPRAYLSMKPDRLVNRPGINHCHQRFQKTLA